MASDMGSSIVAREYAAVCSASGHPSRRHGVTRQRVSCGGYAFVIVSHATANGALQLLCRQSPEATDAPRTAPVLHTLCITDAALASLQVDSGTLNPLADFGKTLMACMFSRPVRGATESTAEDTDADAPMLAVVKLGSQSVVRLTLTYARDLAEDVVVTGDLTLSPTVDPSAYDAFIECEEVIIAQLVEDAAAAAAEAARRLPLASGVGKDTASAPARPMGTSLAAALGGTANRGGISFGGGK